MRARRRRGGERAGVWCPAADSSCLTMVRPPPRAAATAAGRAANSADGADGAGAYADYGYSCSSNNIERFF